MDKIAFPYNKVQIDPLMDEINSAFLRLQNQVLFRNLLKNGGDSQKMFSKELKLDFKKKKVYQWEKRRKELERKEKRDEENNSKR